MDKTMISVLPTSSVIMSLEEYNTLVQRANDAVNLMDRMVKTNHNNDGTTSFEVDIRPWLEAKGAERPEGLVNRSEYDWCFKSDIFPWEKAPEPKAEEIIGEVNPDEL